MADKWEVYSQVKQIDEERRRKSENIKRRRKRQIRRIKGLLCLLLLLSVLAIGGLMAAQKRIGQEQDTENYFDVAVNANGLLVLEFPTEPAVIYPVKSLFYTEVGEAVKSSYVALVDVDGGQVIAGRDCDTRIYPASMTKVMTLIVAVETLESQECSHTFTAEEIYPLVQAQASRAGFDPGEKVGLTDLLYGLILPSGADAAVALAEMTAGSEEAFAELMNRKCEELGLANTHFVNSTGLHDEQQYTTPVEMAVIMEYAMKNETCAEVLSTYQYTTQPTEQHPEGILLTSTMFSRMYGNEVEGVTILSGKTGYTDEAGNCLVSYAQKGGHAYIAVTAYAANKWNCIFDDFELYKNYLSA